MLAAYAAYMIRGIPVTDKRTKMVATWAEGVQALSPTTVNLEDSSAIALKSGDLARETARDLALAFETEPSAFLKLLHDLAPTDGDGQ